MRGASVWPKKQVAEEHGGGEPLLRPTTAVAGVRKKAVGIRPWLLLDSTGRTQLVEVGKHVIMRRTGLPARDLRILDPQLSYPSTVLGRERAIVINLEHIKAIITAHELLLLNPNAPPLIPFVDELQTRISLHQQAVRAQEVGDDLEGPVISPDYSGEEAEGKEQSVENQDGPKRLPFEFVALEACLEAACSCLDSEARMLEQEAHPALDKLTSKISTLNLESVRQIKSRLVTITGRVQKVRDELEHLLDDDGDMAGMYLTDKLEEQLEASWDEADMDDQEPIEKEETLFSGPNAPSRGSHEIHTSIISKPLDVEELEMLLEAYFVQIDGTLNKLSTLREYVDDTEDYINIMLDDKQNHLLEMGVMLTTATLVVSVFIVVAGIFGMNIKIEIFNDHVHGMTRFFWTVGGGTAGVLFLYFIAIACYKHRGLLQ